MVKNTKTKGKALENYVSDQIIEKGLDDRSIRDGGSGAGNREKRDINTAMIVLDRTAGIEVKNHKVPHIKDWWRQTQKLEQLGYEPMLVYKLGGEGYGDTKVVMYLDTVLELIRGQNGAPDEHSGIPSGDKWIVKAAIDNLKKVLKILEKYNK